MFKCRPPQLFYGHRGSRETFFCNRVLREHRQEELHHMATQNPQNYRDETKRKSDDAGEGIIERATETVRSAADQASDLADRALEQGREVGAMAQNVPAAMRDAVNTSLKQQPMATLAVAAALGFVLGALWKS